jgi:nitroreductase
MSFLSNLNWRYAVKKFDPARQVSEEDLSKILEAIRFAPSAYGLQPYHIFVVRDAELRAKLKSKSYLQSQITDSSVLLIFCADSDIGNRIGAYIELASGGDVLAKTKLMPTALIMRGGVGSLKGETARAWLNKQLGIALGFGLAAAAELKIDACPMEGFSTSGVVEALQLPSNLIPTAYLALGYRAEEPKRPKVRFSEKDLFTKL